MILKREVRDLCWPARMIEVTKGRRITGIQAAGGLSNIESSENSGMYSFILAPANAHIYTLLESRRGMIVGCVRHQKAGNRG